MDKCKLPTWLAAWTNVSYQHGLAASSAGSGRLFLRLCSRWCCWLPVSAIDMDLSRRKSQPAASVVANIEPEAATPADASCSTGSRSVRFISAAEPLRFKCFCGCSCRRGILLLVLLLDQLARDDTEYLLDAFAVKRRNLMTRVPASFLSPESRAARVRRRRGC